jgi:uncharacterized protein (DUF983 family)
MEFKPDPLASRAAPTLPKMRNETFDTLLKGFRGYCPACGKGRMFRAYLKVADACPACGEELHHHRADDFPAYLVMAMCVSLLQPVKGAVVALQWHLHMHGFEESRQSKELQPVRVGAVEAAETVTRPLPFAPANAGISR